MFILIDLGCSKIQCQLLASKEDYKVELDVAAWMFNVVTSVGIIMLTGNICTCFPSTDVFHTFIQVSCSIVIGTNFGTIIAIVKSLGVPLVLRILFNFFVLSYKVNLLKS